MASTTEQWWRFQRLARGPREDRVALERGEHPQAQAAYDDDLALVGAGPLEDLLVAHGSRFVDSCTESARRSPTFARALRAVSLPEGMPGSGAARQLRPWTDGRPVD